MSITDAQLQEDWANEIKRKEQEQEAQENYANQTPSFGVEQTQASLTQDPSEEVQPETPIEEPVDLPPEPIQTPQETQPTVTNKDVAKAAIERAAGKQFETETKEQKFSPINQEKLVSPFQQEQKFNGELTAESMYLPTDHPNNILNHYSDQDYEEIVTSKEGRDYLMVMNRGQELIPNGGALLETTSNQDAYWSQAIDSANGQLSLTRPAFDDAPRAKLKGNAAVIRVNTLMGLNSLVTVPLWHSGFWVTIKTPTDVELVNLEHQLAQAKISLGRALSGSIYSNESVYIAEAVYKLFESKIFSTTLKEGTKDLASKISVHDIQTIAWALACAIYPKGYHYTRSVLSSEPTDTSIVTGNLDLNKISWTNYKALSDYQVKHMAQRFDSNMTDDQIQQYRESFTHATTKRVVMTEEGSTSLSVVLKVPTLKEYFDKGDEWIQKTIMDADKVLTYETTDDERQAYTTRLANARIMGKHGHFIKNVIFSAGSQYPEEIYDDEETISSFLEAWSSDLELYLKLEKEIIDFKDATTMSLIATPTVSPQETQNNQFPHLVPMDAVLTFFILLGQKLSKLD